MHGFHDATTEIGWIQRYWSRRPDMNVAIATGGNGPDVLDVDVAHGRAGYRWLHEAIRAGLIPAPMGTVRTPSGGMHLYYCGDAQRNGSLPRHGLDFRGQGGYVLAPPSQVAGRPYVVVSQWHPGPVSIDFGRIRERFAPRPEPGRREVRTGGAPGRLAAWVASQRPGNRNQATFWAACRAAEAGDAAELGAIADAAIGTGLEADAVRKTIASAVRTAGRGQLSCEREAAS